MSSEGNFNEQWLKKIANFDLNDASELRVELLKKEEDGSILLQISTKTENGNEETASQTIELPIALLPELKRSIDALEHAIVDENSTSNSKEVEEDEII